MPIKATVSTTLASSRYKRSCCLEIALNLKHFILCTLDQCQIFFLSMGFQKTRVLKNSGSKKLGFQKTRVPKNSGSKTLGFQQTRVPKNSGSKKLGFQKTRVPTNSGSKKLGFQKTGLQKKLGFQVIKYTSTNSFYSGTLTLVPWQKSMESTIPPSNLFSKRRQQSLVTENIEL